MTSGVRSHSVSGNNARLKGAPRWAQGLLGVALVLVLALTMGALAASSAQADGTIVATKGGDRSTSANVSGATTYASPVSGAVFEYTTGNPTLPATTWTAFPSATGANGQASVTVPNGITYVREKTPATGFTNFGPVTNLSFNGSQPYVARVNVQNGQTSYAFPHTNTDNNPTNWTPTNGGSATNNGSPFINVRDNSTLPPGCGTNILLVLDRSGSIEPYKDTYKAAAKEFVSQLNGTPTQIGIVSFNNAVNSYQPATGNASFYQSPLSLANAGSAATLNTKIDNVYNAPENLTNWDGVLQAASQAKSFTPDAGTGQSANPDLVVFITDGNPTTSNVSTSGSNEDLINLTSGMASANLVKNQTGRAGFKTKMLAIGVGDGVTIDNLKVVSGPDEGVDGDYAAPTIPQLQAFLSELAASQCGARVYVRKLLAGGNTNQAGWFYTAVDPRPGKTPTYQDNNRATHSSGNPPVIETGAFFSQLPSTPTTVNVNEDAAGQPLSNFELTSVDCRRDSYGGTPVAGGVKTGLNFSLPVNRGDSIYCTYTNALKTTLSINKTPDAGVINAGDDAEFTMQVSNTGANQATGVTLSDTLPAPGVGGWTISSQPAGNPCSIAGNALSCNFGNLNAGASVTVKVKTGTSFAACGVYDNPTATASATNAPQVTNAGKITCNKPNLTVSKTGNGPINAGQDAEFTIGVNNAGPGVAKSVTLNDPLPAGTAGGWSIVSQPAGNPCSIAANTLTCNFGDMNAGASAQVKVKAATSNANCTVYNNTATASSTNHPNATGTASITCNKPSLGTLKTAVQGTISAGDTAEFSITVSNGGPGTANGVTLSDPLPSGVSGAWTIDTQPAGNPCSITAGTLNCNFGNLAAGASVTVKVKAPTNFENCSTLVNLATASSTNAPSSSDDATIQCNKPNLSVNKTGNGPVNAGDQIEFTVEVKNAGPGVARGVTLNDPLPAGTSAGWAIGSQPAGDPCSIAANTLSCSFGDVAAGVTHTVKVVANTSYAACTTYNNTATASATNSPNATDDASIVCNKPNLSIVKTAGNGTINAGDDAEFTIQVSNAGPGVAKNVKIGDPLPSGTASTWSIVSQPAGNPCSITAGVLNCSLGNMASGASATVKVKAATNAQHCAVYDNVATQSSDNSPSSSDDAKITCQSPDLKVTKTGNGTVSAGDDVEFTITTTNSGAGTAKAVTLSDTLPTGTAGAWTIVSQPAGNPCSISAGVLSCSFGDMAAGASAQVKVKAPTSAQNCAAYDNDVTVKSSNNPDATDDATVTCQKPGITINKTGNGTINAGDDVQFTVNVSNSGPGTAKSVTLSDPLPTGTAGAWTIVSQPAGNPCSITVNTLNCSFGDMPAGASAEVKVKAATDHDGCKVFDNTATASAANASQVQDSDSVKCEKADLGVLKTAVQGTISAGDTAEFSISVTNTGPGVAKDVTLHDPLPTGVSGAWTIDSQPAGNPCSITANTLNCDFGDLNDDQTVTVKVKATTSFEQCGTLVNLATASSSNTPDASDSATINCNKPNLSIEKTGNGTINAGEDIQFTIKVDNAGPGTAKAVTLSDTLPSGTAGAWTIESQPAGNPCSVTAGVLNCSFGDLTAGTSKEVKLKAPTSAQYCTEYDNSATASASNSPQVSDEDTVTCQKGDLGVLKTAVQGTISAGDDAVFSISVTNTGPGVAKDVTLSDPLPTGVSGPWTITDQPAGNPCSIASNTLTCDFGDLADDQTVTVKVKAATDFENCTLLENKATASSSNTPDASDDATIHCNKPNLSVEKTGNGTINAGENAEFTIKVSNAGPGTAKSVTLSDPLPTGTADAWVIVSQPAGDPCAITVGTLNCSFGDLADDASVEVKVSAKTSHEACSEYENTATASASNAPDAEGSDTVTCEKADLGVLKTAVQGTISAGDLAQFSISVTNTGPGVAKDVTLSDPLPPGVSGSWTIDTQPAGNPCSITAGVLNCDFGDLNDDQTVTVKVKAATSFEQCGTLVNLATASSSNTPDATGTATIGCNKPNVSVAKSGNGPVSAGENVEFSVKVKNSGPGVAKNVTLSDPLPPGTAGAWTIASQPGGNPCSIAGTTLNCDFGDLASGVTVEVKVKAPTSAEQCTKYDNTATASADNSPDVNGSASVTCGKAGLSVVKTGNGSIKAGERATFSMTVTNNGPGIAKAVTLSDPLPSGTAEDWEITSQPAGDPCAIVDGTLSCNFGDMAAGASATVEVSAATNDSHCRTYENLATASGSNTPAVTGEDTVTCTKIKPKIQLKKSANRKKVFPGDKVRYKIQIRNVKKGSVAKNLKICDRLPTRMSVVSKGDDAYFDNGRLCWNVKQLGYSKKWKTFTYTAQVDEGVEAGQKLKNVVTVGNKRATWTVTVKSPPVSPARRVTPVTG